MLLNFFLNNVLCLCLVDTLPRSVISAHLPLVMSQRAQYLTQISDHNLAPTSLVDLALIESVSAERKKNGYFFYLYFC